MSKSSGSLTQNNICFELLEVIEKQDETIEKEKHK
jgi:hypothetical protein